MTVRESEMNFIQYFRLDTVGTKFLWNGRLFIKVYKQAETLVRRMFDSGLLNALELKKLLIPTWISDIQFEGCGLVLEQKYYKDCIGYEYWTTDMVKDAGIVYLDAAKICVEYGFGFSDSNLGNVIYVEGRFQICDIGAFCSRKDYGRFSPIVRNIKTEFIYPLKMCEKNMFGDEVFNISKGMDNSWKLKCISGFRMPITIARKSRDFESFIYSIYENEWETKRSINPKKIIKNVIKAYVDYGKRNQEKMKKKTLSEIEKAKRTIINTNTTFNTDWALYQSEMSVAEPSERFVYLAGICHRLNAASAIELGANQGYFSRLLLEKEYVKRAVATDYDMGAINKCYLYSKKYAGKLLSYRVDFHQLSQESARKFRADLVIALAMLHHLILRQGADIDGIFDRLSWLTTRYVVVEFMPLGLWGGGGQLPLLPSWYNEEWFVLHMKRRFKILERKQLEKNRIVYVGEVCEQK